jgi:hypothetical protein
MLQLSPYDFLDPGMAMRKIEDAICELQAGGGGSGGGDGAQGPQGDPGPQGPQGPAGPAGQDGGEGPVGPQGVQGVAGPAGPQGPAGASAPQAPSLPGLVGPVGPQGPAGPAGPQGLQGVQGVAGHAGQDGEQGPAGPQGSPGTSTSLWPYTYIIAVNPPPGNNNVCSNGTTASATTTIWVSSLDDNNIDQRLQLMLANTGDELFVQKTDDSTCNAVFTLSGPPVDNSAYVTLPVTFVSQGPTQLIGKANAVVLGIRMVGPQGPQGVAGPAGPQGPQGDTGPQGLQGPIGPGGAVGPIGPTGQTGEPGAQGPQGAQGTVGGIGPAGPQGLQGPAGAVGAQGVQGPPGPTAVSANANNTATLGSDGLIFVPLAPGGSNANPAMDGTAAAGSASVWSRGDHVHPTDTSRQPLKGFADGSNAAAGNAGEQVSVSVTTAVTLTTGVAVNVASLALTAGDWTVSGVIIFNEATNTVPTMLAAAVSMSSAVLPTAAQVAAGTGNMTQYNLTFTKGPITQTMQAGVCRVNVSAATTVYLVAQATFSTAGLTATGYVSARRVR